MRRYGLRDDQWDRIKDLLPGRKGSVGVTADNRLFVEAVLYRYRAGIPWRDLPERFGDWKNIHRRFSRWAIVLIEVSVEQKDRNRMSMQAGMDVEPRADPDRSLRDISSATIAFSGTHHCAGSYQSGFSICRSSGSIS